MESLGSRLNGWAPDRCGGHSTRGTEGRGPLRPWLGLEVFWGLGLWSLGVQVWCGALGFSGFLVEAWAFGDLGFRISTCIAV